MLVNPSPQSPIPSPQSPVPSTQYPVPSKNQNYSLLKGLKRVIIAFAATKEVSQLYRTIPIRAKFTLDEQAFWIDQCQHANGLTNSAIYYVRQTHYARLEKSENAVTTYWLNRSYRKRCLESPVFPTRGDVKVKVKVLKN